MVALMGSVRSLMVPVPGGFASVTVSHLADEDAETLTNQAISTLQEI